MVLVLAQAEGIPGNHQVLDAKAQGHGGGHGQGEGKVADGHPGGTAQTDQGGAGDHPRQTDGGFQAKALGFPARVRGWRATGTEQDGDVAHQTLQQQQSRDAQDHQPERSGRRQARPRRPACGGDDYNCQDFNPFSS